MHTRFQSLSLGAATTWPERLHEMASTWASLMRPEDRARLREDVWVLVVGALQMHIRRQSGQRAGLDPSFAYDLAVEKALDILAAFAREEWDPRDYEPAQLQHYFALLARNAVIDRVRSAAHRQQARETGVEALDDMVGSHPEAGERIAHLGLAEAVAACAARLTRRAWAAWFLRAFGDFSSRRIARHPAVGMTPAAVDMSLTRSRRSMQNCLQKKGFTPTDLGAGAFTACWEAFREDRGLLGEAHEEGETP